MSYRLHINGLTVTLLAISRELGGKKSLQQATAADAKHLAAIVKQAKSVIRRGLVVIRSTGKSMPVRGDNA